MRTIPELKEGTHRAKATGTLPNGKPVIVNADGTVSVVEGSDLSVGTPVDVGGSNRNIDLVSSTFDSNSNKVVVAYRDRDGSFYGTAIVGTVSGSTISFGTPVVFLSATSQKPAITFDSSNNKIIIAVYDGGSQIATYVGTVSGASISFGSRVNLPSAPNYTSFIAATFDSNSNKVVLAWQDQSNSSYGTAIVGTVSGTSISYGSFSVFESASTGDITATFDSNSNKVVISYADNGSSGRGTAVVGTVSVTSISFGTPVVYNSSDVNYPCIAFDSINNKVVVSFADNSNSYSGTSMVGIVSGASISFGAKTVYYQGSVDGIATTFDSTTGQIVTLGRDSKLAYFGTVSGTTISYNSSISFSDGSLVDNNAMSIVFDNNSNKIVTPYRLSSGDFGKATVVSPASTTLTSENYIGMSTGGTYADGSSATVDIIGTLNEDQSGLTAGQSYYVQVDGTIGEATADPSVFAGTAISATSLVVKT